MATPTLVSATIIASGLLIQTVWSEAAVVSVQGATLSIAGRLLTASPISGSGSPGTTINFTVGGGITVYIGEVVTVTFPAGTVVDQATGLLGNALITDRATVNNSTAALSAACDGAASGLLVNKCMILRETSGASTSSGAETRTWAPVYYPVCCNIQASGASESFAGQQENASANYNGYFPASLALEANDRICTITGAGVRGLAGKVLDVVGAPSDHAGRGAYLWAPLTEITGYG